VPTILAQYHRTPESGARRAILRRVAVDPLKIVVSQRCLMFTTSLVDDPPSSIMGACSRAVLKDRAAEHV
jgi:hypothetical protein